MVGSSSSLLERDSDEGEVSVSGNGNDNDLIKYTYKVGNIFLYMNWKVSDEHHLTNKARVLARSTLKS